MTSQLTFCSISRSTHEDVYKKTPRIDIDHPMLYVYTRRFFLNVLMCGAGDERKCTKTCHFLYVFLTREMLVQLVNFEKVTAPYTRGSARLGPCPQSPPDANR